PNTRKSLQWLAATIVEKARLMTLGEALPAEVFRHDPVARRLAELADVERSVLPEYLLPQLERILPAERLGPILAAATAREASSLVTLLQAELAHLAAPERREVDLYCHLLEGRPVQPVSADADWIAGASVRLCDLLVSEPAQGILKGWVERGVGRLLAIPIGVPRRVVGDERLAQIEDVLVNQILALLGDHAHRIAQAIDLKDMVRQRILAADPRAIEEVVKGRLAKREFNTIFSIGLLFGGVVGLAATAFFGQVALHGGWPWVVAAGAALIFIMLRLVRV
ncbi:MAG: hypothetical protein KGR26_15545, partial [Cyanobacteria bacterium REEB65]|nr:hypothetical protein [Cyanobacteria bacterium REEB65]